MRLLRLIVLLLVATIAYSEDPGYSLAGENCNCGSTRIEIYRDSNLDECFGHCEENGDCVSFGVWTEKDLGLCALFDELCTQTCPYPTDTDGGWFNDAYNMKMVITDEFRCECLREWYSEEDSCGCGIESDGCCNCDNDERGSWCLTVDDTCGIDNYGWDYCTKEKGYSLAGENCNCGSTRIEIYRDSNLDECFGHCEENGDCVSFGVWTERDVGLCALFDELCTQTCHYPTDTDGGWFNDAYNMKMDLEKRTHNGPPEKEETQPRINKTFASFLGAGVTLCGAVIYLVKRKRRKGFNVVGAV